MTTPFAEDLQAVAGLGGPDWLAGRRRAAAASFAALGFPTTKNENWHYTSVAPIADRDFGTLRTPTGDASGLDLTPYDFGRPEWPILVFLNGRFVAGRSTPAERLPEGIRVATLGALLSEGANAPDGAAELVEQHLGMVADNESHAFVALNTALATDGAVVVVGSEMVVDTPLHLVFITDDSTDGKATHPRTLLVAGRHCKATLIESYIGLGEANYLTNAVTEVLMGDGATFTNIKVQRESPAAFHVDTTTVHQARDSHYLHFSCALGAALSRTNVYTTLDGEGSGATLNGLYMLDGEQHCDHQTRIEHAKPNTFSRELYKGLLDGHSRGVFNGKVYVQPEAQKTDGKQENNNILLSPTAHIDTKPELEIYADDVKCTHGATVGRLDETALFYMKSRGISAVHARQLLTYAFAADVLETIEIDEVRDSLEALTMARFTKNEVGAA
ncbi:MAG: Fe-S cluster assembly protein SufD [Gemmatimonadaceae bacterium]